MLYCMFKVDVLCAVSCYISSTSVGIINYVRASPTVYLRTYLAKSLDNSTTALLHGRHARKSRKKYVLKRERGVINIKSNNCNTVKAVKHHHHHVKIVLHQGHEVRPLMMLITERAIAAERGKTYHTAQVLVKLTRKLSMMRLQQLLKQALMRCFSRDLLR
jgi:hypothetical protein